MSKNKNRRYNYTDYNKVQNTSTEDASEEFKMESVEPVDEVEEDVAEISEDVAETVEEPTTEITEDVAEAVAVEESTTEITEDTVEEAADEPIVEDAEVAEEEIIPKTGVALKYSNIRQQPDPNSAVVGKLQVGQKAEVFGTFNGYWKIIAEPITGVTVNGYIRSDLMDVK